MRSLVCLAQGLAGGKDFIKPSCYHCIISLVLPLSWRELRFHRMHLEQARMVISSADGCAQELYRHETYRLLRCPTDISFLTS